MSHTDDNLAPQTQKQRWIKYGANVALTIIIVIVLAVLITYLAQRNPRRLDTTSARIYSLKPQTVSIITDLQQPVRIVSLYARPDQPAGDTDYAQAVDDLLAEYQRKGRNIEVESIDPAKNPSKVDALINYVTAKYGGEIRKYQDFLDRYPADFEQIKNLSTDEAARVAQLPLTEITDPELQQTVILAIASVQEFPKQLEEGRERINRRLKLKPPDYKGAVEGVQSSMETLSALIAQVLADFEKSKDDPKVPAAIRQYMTDSRASYEQIKKLADDIVANIKGLGELKLDELRQKLRERDAILVMGEKEMRSLSFDQVWQAELDVKQYLSDPNAPLKPRFAGEQQISAAILSLTSPGKPKVAFIRAGGPPLTTPGFPPFQRGGPLSEVAARLRDYNFDVVEKDLSGMWAMQSQMQGMPTAPEPGDEELKSAVWVVLGVPSDPRMGMMSTPIAPKLAEHLRAGGSALVLTLPQAENFDEALEDYGIEMTPGAVIVKEVPAGERARSADLAEEAQRLPFVFVVNNYGQHMLTSPLRSLDMILVGMVPVKATGAEGVKTTSLLPIPTSPTAWGERDIESASGENLKFDKDTDIPGPLFAGAVAEKEGGARLVVIGGLQTFTNQILNIPDTEMARRRIFVARFPGNSELFINAVFWLAKMEPMIAISPAAMEVSRIAPMSDTALKGWRIGVLLILLPGSVLVAGVWMYFARRD